MTLHRDHIAGGAFVAAGALILTLSRDLPFGTLASPGAGMMPTLVIVLMMIFGLILVLRAGASPPLADIEGNDLWHAARVVAVTAAGVAVYQSLGFIASMSLLLFVFIFAIERQPILRAALFSIGVTALAYLIFDTLLKAPLPRGLIWF
ncbi:MAG TPA: tripartite tricarboxylate transporter TctB family protein [Hyphomicrobiales bacterium]|jgi:putative tricarboxylic transport membrane protein